MSTQRRLLYPHQESRQRGFTLIEIMVVVIIIGILISMVGTNIFPALEEAEVTATEFQLQQIENSLSMYRMKNARFPTSEEGLNPWMLWEWRRVSIPEWRRILQESIDKEDTRREEYARWMLRDILLDPEYQEVES